MDVSLETLVAYLAGQLDARTRQGVDEALAQSGSLRNQLARLRIATNAVQADTGWHVPATAIESAKALGRRLEALRPPSILEHVSRTIASVVARLAFDSRAEGALVGLRGETGFALAFKTDDADIELECDIGHDELWHLLGQISAPRASFARVRAWRDDQHVETAAPAAETTIDHAGMFRLALAAGRYRFRFDSADASIPSVELPTTEIP